MSRAAAKAIGDLVGPLLAPEIYVLATYPLAKVLPVGKALARRGARFWIVTGTGFTLALGETAAEAWINSAELLRGLVERPEVECEWIDTVRVERWREMEAHG